MRSLSIRVLAVLSILLVPAFAFAANVTINGTTTFAALDGGVDDEDHVANGVFTVTGNLTVNGTINCNDDGAGANSACPMQFVVGGNLVLNAGSAVFAENRTKAGNGGDITFTVGGDALVQGATLSLPGALVSSAKTNGGNPAHGGAITFNVAGAYTQGFGSTLSSAAADATAGAISIISGGQATLGGFIFAGPSRTLASTVYTGAILTGGGGHVVGGAITVRAMTHVEPGVAVANSAVIASQGTDGGGNTVMLEACNIQVNGLVAALAHKNGAPRVVIRSGTTLTIDGSNLDGSGFAHLGKVRADEYGESASANRADLFAAKDIVIAGPSAPAALFAVTSNPGDKGDAGSINVISVAGSVTASGNAFAATGSDKDQSGGNINLSAKNNVTLSGTSIIAAGGTTGASRGGGNIAVRSYSGALNWTAGVGDVRPVGSAAGVPAAQQGTIALTYCTTLSTSGTSFPTNGSPVGVFPTTAQTCSPAAPSLPSGETLPTCNTPPVANNTSATTLEDNAVTVTMTASDADGDSLTFSIVTGPLHGSLGAIFNATPTSAQVTYTPDANYNGSDSFTFKADDGKGGTSTGTVSITITPVNDPPTFNLGANPVSSLEDAGPQTRVGYASSISPGPTADEASQTVTFTVTNDNNALFSAQPAIASNGTLTYTTAPNANGSANVTVVAHDNGGTANGGNDTSAAQNFNLVVTAVNDAPSFTKGADQAVNEDAGAQSVANWATAISAGPADENGQTVTFNVTNDNNALFSAQPAVASNGTLTYTPAPNANGTATVTVVAHDDGGTANGGVDTSAAQTFTITVNAVNDAPSFTSGGNVTVLEDSGAYSQPWATAISAGPANESSQSVTFTTNNDNNALFSAQPSVAADGTLTFTPATDANGTATVTVIAHDDGGTANGGVDTSAAQTFTITVTAVNDAPSFTKGADVTVNEDSGAYSQANWATAISAGPANESSQTVSFTVSNSNNALFSAQPSVDASGTLTFTSAPNANGTATVTVAVHDDGGTANGGVDTSAAQTFTITVTAVNDAPSFTKGADVTVLEDSGAYSQANWATAISAGPADESSQSVSFTTTNDNNALFSAQPSVTANGTLSFTTAPDAFGTATVSVVAHDDGGTANGGVDTSAAQTFTITLSPVNDAPSFTKGPDVSVFSDAGPQNDVNWATNISAGPANESAQTVSFIVSNDNNAVFTSQPAVSSSGTLTFTTAVSAPTTTVHVSVAAHDNGGTANGGVDTSAAQTFNINVTHANQPPTAVNDSFDAVGNTELAVGTPGSQAATLATTGSLLANDSDPDGDPIVAALGSASAGANVTVNSDGTFTYLPPVGFTGDDTFTYTVSDDHGHTVTGTVTIHVTKRVLYVKNDGGGSTGRVDSPFTTLAAAQAAAADNDTIYVFIGDGTNNGQSNGVILSHNGERLIGEGVALNASGVYNGVTNPQLRIAGNTRPQISNAAGSAVTIAGVGTISNIEASGINILSAGAEGMNATAVNGLTMTSDVITAATHSGVRGTNISNFTFANGTVTTGGTVSADANLRFDGLTGTASVTNATFSGAFGDNIRVTNSSGSLNRITFDHVTLNGNSATTGNNGILLTGGNNAVMNVTVTNSNFNAARSVHFQVALSGSGSTDVVFDHNTVANGQVVVGGGGGIQLTTGGTGSTVAMTYAITNNSFTGANGNAITVSKGVGTGSASGSIDNNTVGVQSSANSGSASGTGISVVHIGGGTSTTSVTNNRIYQYNSVGVSLQIGDNTSGGNGNMAATVTGNTISNPGAFASNGFLLNAGTTTGDQHAVCLTLGGSGPFANAMTGSGPSADFRLRQRMATTVRLPGYAGANNDNAAVTAFVQSNNGGTPTGSVSNTVPTGGGFIGGTCP